MRRVTVFLPNMGGGGGGGAQRCLGIVASGLAERGWPVSVVLATAEGPYLHELSSKVEVHDLKAPRTIASLPRLIAYCRREKPEVLMSTLEHANVGTVLARRLSGCGARVVLREANDLYTPHEAQLRSYREATAAVRWAHRLAPRMYRSAERIVAVSQGVKDSMVRGTGCDPDRVSVIYNPILTPELAALAREEPSHPWYREDIPVLLAVGRLWAQKDYPTMLHAFQQIRREKPSRLIVLGEGPEQAALTALAAELGVGDDVDFPGFEPNPFAHMRKAAVYMMSSAWEGLPGAMIQAMACGCPVVSTDCPSGPREVLGDGAYGHLVPVGDVDGLARSALDVLTGGARIPPAEWMEQFQPEIAVSRYADVIEQAASA